MDENFEDVEPLPSKRFQKIDLAVTGLCLLYNVSQALTSALETVTDLAAMHSNYKVDQRNLARQMALDIETITSEEE